MPAQSIRKRAERRAQAAARTDPLAPAATAWDASDSADRKQVLLLDPALPSDAGIAAFLDAHRLRTKIVRDLDEAIAACRERRFDLALVDPARPLEEGLNLCKTMAALTGAPIVVWSKATEPLDRVAYLEFVADDCLDKDCHPLELLARLRALMRRARQAPRTVPKGDARLFEFSGCRFDASTGALSSAAAGLRWLSRSESELLSLFVQRPREVLSRHEIIRRLFGDERGASLRSVDVRVRRLRRALGEAGEDPERIIRTSHSAGYIFSADVAPVG